MVCYGTTTAVTSFTVGRLLKYVPRLLLMTVAAVSNIGVCVVLLHWNPNAQQIANFYILSSLWGFSEAIWCTQLPGKK